MLTVKHMKKVLEMDKEQPEAMTHATDPQAQRHNAAGDLLCRLCDDPALAVFATSDGCICAPGETEMPLCLHHAERATPLGTMEIKRDLTTDGSFTKWWTTEARR